MNDGLLVCSISFGYHNWIDLKLGQIVGLGGGGGGGGGGIGG